MDRIADWRPVDTTGPDGKAEDRPGAAGAEGGVHWRLVAFGALALAGLAGAALVLSAAAPSSGFTLGPDDRLPLASEAAGALPASPTAELVVDVGGAVERPGLFRLAQGSRVGDAIAAAGGYSVAVDLEAAARQLNLAERLADGAKIHVPRRGQASQLSGPDGSTPLPAGGNQSGSGGGGLVDVNTASQQELETLPGIGPVTAGKIMAARQEAPFASVDDLLERRVVGPATFEKIRALVTAGQ